MNQAIELLDQIIALAIDEDRQLTAAKNRKLPCYLAQIIPQGDSPLVFHLKTLKELLQNRISGVDVVEECKRLAFKEKSERTDI